MADAQETSMSLLKEIGRVKIELNSCSEGGKAELQAKLDGLLAEHAAAGAKKAETSDAIGEPPSAPKAVPKGPERPRAKSKSQLNDGEAQPMPKAVQKGPERIPRVPRIQLPTSHPPMEGESQAVPKVQKAALERRIPTSTPGESQPAKAAQKGPERPRIPKPRPAPKAGQSELDSWLQKQRRKASEDGLNFSGGGARSTADVVPAAKAQQRRFASGRPGEAQAFDGLILSKEGEWSLHDDAGSYVFDDSDGWLMAADSREKLGRLSLAQIQETPLQLDSADFSKLTSQNLGIVSSEIMLEIQKIENEGALFVLPSQLNGAEYPSDSSIKKKVVDYKYDNTGGPRGQLAVHPAVAQFLLDNAANLDRQGGINAVDEVLSKVSGLELVNGYLKIQDGDEAANSKTLEQLRQSLHHLRPLVMDEVPSCGLAPNKGERSSSSHKVGLVYASAVPVDAYLNRSANASPEHQRAVAELILVAQYLGALRYAAKTKAATAANSGRRKVFLMPLGGGVFNNPWDLIAKSMARAVQMMDLDALASLEILALAWQGNPSEEAQLQQMFLTLNPGYQESENTEGPDVESTLEEVSKTASGRVSFSHPDDVRHFHAEDSPKKAPLAIHGLEPSPAADTPEDQQLEPVAPKEEDLDSKASAEPVEDVQTATLSPPAAEPAEEVQPLDAPAEAAEDVQPLKLPDAAVPIKEKQTSLASLAASATAASEVPKAKAKASPKVRAKMGKSPSDPCVQASKDVKAAKGAAVDVKAATKAKPEVKAAAKVKATTKAAKAASPAAKANGEAPPKAPAAPAKEAPAPKAKVKAAGSKEKVAKATGSEGPEVPKNVEVKAKAKTARPARPPATASPPAVDAKPAKPAPAKPVPAVKAAAKARSSSTTGGASQAAKVPGSRPLTRVSSKALEKKAKEMEQNVKAAQAACLRDSRQSSGRLKSLEVEAASLRRALEAVPAEHSSAIQKVDLPAAASAVPSAPEPPAEEPAEEPPAEEPPPNAETADAEEAEEAPRSTSSSLRLKLESLVREEDDEQLAAELQKVLASEAVKERSSAEHEVSQATRSDQPKGDAEIGGPGEDATEPAKSSGRDAKPKKLLPRSPPKVSPKVSPKPSPRPSEASQQETDHGDRPAWDDRFYVVQVPKPRRRSGLEEEHLAKDEVPEKKNKKKPPLKPPPPAEEAKGEAKAAPKRSPKAKPKPQEKARAANAEAKSAQALTAARFAADRHKRQASR